MREGYEIYHEILYKKLVEYGLSNLEAAYVVNVVTNKVRSCGDTSCCDNFRISVDGKQDERYEQQRRNGCCGFFDDEIVLRSGKHVKIGFNYGH